jgi:hypothetical protein
VQRDTGGQEGDYGVPTMMEEYHSVVALEDPNSTFERVSGVFDVPTLVLKAISLRDGKPYALRRISQVWLINPPKPYVASVQCCDTFSLPQSRRSIVSLS